MESSSLINTLSLTNIRPTIILLATLVLLPITHSLASGIEIGTVIYAQGDVTAISDNEKPRALSNDNKLYNGDLIKTGSDGKIYFKLINNSVRTLLPDSEFRITKSSYTDSIKNYKVDTIILKAGLRG